MRLYYEFNQPHSRMDLSRAHERPCDSGASMATKYWMISDRNIEQNRLGADRADLSYWVSEGGPLDQLGNWKQTKSEQFKRLLASSSQRFPLILDMERHEEQKHVTIFIHGYNSDWGDAARMYESLCGKLFEGDETLGICLLFSWPSDGMMFGYYPDRIDARRCAADLAEILGAFYDWLVIKQVEGVEDAKKACRAKISVICHSMGNYLLQKGMQLAWTRKNQPMLVSLVNQLLMVAADVDNDLFKSGESVQQSDGDAIANLTYRITALFTGRDNVLGLSAGMKHFGKRRLGRSGLDRTFPCPDNLWQVDCSSLFSPEQANIHSAYFEEPKTIELMREVLRGVDRSVLIAQGLAPA